MHRDSPLGLSEESLTDEIREEIAKADHRYIEDLFGQASAITWGNRQDLTENRNKLQALFHGQTVPYLPFTHSSKRINIGKTGPIPNARAYVTVSQNIPKEDEKRWRYCPYFGENDDLKRDDHLYSDDAPAEESEVDDERSEFIIKDIVSKYGDKENTMNVLSDNLGKSLRMIRKCALKVCKTREDVKKKEESRLRATGIDSTLNTLTDSYRRTFCRRCYVYHCQAHLHSHPRKRKLPPTNQVDPKLEFRRPGMQDHNIGTTTPLVTNVTTPRIGDQKCSSSCFLALPKNTLPRFVQNSQQLSLHQIQSKFPRAELLIPHAPLPPPPPLPTVAPRRTNKNNSYHSNNGTSSSSKMKAVNGGGCSNNNGNCSSGGGCAVFTMRRFLHGTMHQLRTTTRQQRNKSKRRESSIISSAAAEAASSSSSSSATSRNNYPIVPDVHAPEDIFNHQNIGLDSVWKEKRLPEGPALLLLLRRHRRQKRSRTDGPAAAVDDKCDEDDNEDEEEEHGDKNKGQPENCHDNGYTTHGNIGNAFLSLSSSSKDGNTSTIATTLRPTSSSLPPSPSSSSSSSSLRSSSRLLALRDEENKKRTAWSKEEKSLISSLGYICGANPCKIASLIGTRTCSQVWEYIQHHPIRQADPCIEQLGQDIIIACAHDDAHHHHQQQQQQIQDRHYPSHHHHRHLHLRAVNNETVAAVEASSSSLQAATTTNLDPSAAVYKSSRSTSGSSRSNISGSTSSSSSRKNGDYIKVVHVIEQRRRGSGRGPVKSPTTTTTTTHHHSVLSSSASSSSSTTTTTTTTTTATTSSSRMNGKRKRKRTRAIKKKKSRRTLRESAIRMMNQAHRDLGHSLAKMFKPCSHSGPCSIQNKDVCSCVRNGTFCEKFCGCDDDCQYRFPGCQCTKGCGTRACPCFAASRECDPDLCKACGAHKIPLPQEEQQQQQQQQQQLLLQEEEEEEGQEESMLSSLAAVQITSNYRSCTNIRLRYKKYKHLLLGRSKVHGWGCFVSQPVRKNELVCEYLGEVVSQEEADRRGKIYDKQSCSYLFNLNQDEVIDAARKGNKIKFANHSRDRPNCHPRVISVNGDHHIAIYAKSDLKAGDELFFDYKHDFCSTLPDWYVNKINDFASN